MVSAVPRAFGLGPLETIVNVQWVSGFFLYVEAKAIYLEGTPGTRTAVLTLSPAGRDAGGSIIDSKFEQVPEVLGDEGHPAFTFFKALLKFTKQPKRLGEILYAVEFAGSIQDVDGSQPPPLEQPFCGTSTSVGEWSNIYAIPVPGNPNLNAFLAQDVTWTYTTPAGTSVANFTNGPLADVSAEQVGTGARTITGTDNSVWYVDAFGNYINTGLECSTLTAGIKPATRTEGWDYLKVEVIPVNGYRARDVDSWTVGATSVLGAIEDATGADPSRQYGSPAFIARIGQRFQGVNSDSQPIMDDLPTGKIEFTNVFLSFDDVPKNKPPARFQTYASYPVRPQYASYSIFVAVNSPVRAYHPPLENVPGTAFPVNTREKLFPPGTTPPVDQTFNPLP